MILRRPMCSIYTLSLASLRVEFGSQVWDPQLQKT